MGFDFSGYLKKQIIRKFFPGIYIKMQNFKRNLPYYSKNRYPQILRNEYKAVRDVLKSSNWNMNYGNRHIHEKLEEEFAAYTGSRYAVAVNTGGMAIQISLRALGLKPGDEIIHQVDTCVADPFAIINAGCTPLFSDISLETLMLSEASLEKWISDKTRAIMPVHMWGNSENMLMVTEFARRNKLIIIEDSALALGSKYNGKMTGTFGAAGIFSFGCLKPLQTGEGGMIITNDADLAKEMRVIRNWGDTTKEYGYRDQKTLSWNGRISEIISAVALEQLRAYPELLSNIHENVETYYLKTKNMEGFQPLVPLSEIRDHSFTQLVIKIDENKLGRTKASIMNDLQKNGILVWHSNFEPLTTLSFFKEGHWKEWIMGNNTLRINDNYKYDFPNSKYVYKTTGIGFLNTNFVSKHNVNRLLKVLDKVLSKK